MNAHSLYLLATLAIFAAGCTNEPPPVTEAGSTTGLAAEPATGAPVSESEAVKPDDAAAQIRLDPVATSLAGQPIYLSAAKVVDFSHDGKQLAVGHGSGDVHLWNVADARHYLTLRAHTEWAFDLAFSPDDRFLATAGGDNQIRIFELANLEIHKTRPRQPDDSHGIVFAEQGKSLSQHEDDVHGVAFTPAGLHLITGGDDARVLLWDLKQNSSIVLSGHGKQVTAIAMAASGQLAASASRDHTIRLWSLPAGKESGLLSGHAADVIAIDFSPDGKVLAATDYDGKVILWDVAEAKIQHSIDGHQGRAYAVAYHPAGKMIASGGDDNTLRLWNAEDGTTLQDVNVGVTIAGLAYSPDGKRLAAATTAGTVILFDVTGNGVGEQKVWIPPGFISLPVNAKLERPNAATSLRQHDIAASLKHPEWPDTVGLLSQSGDQFTLELLKGLDATSLSPANLELLVRSITALEARVQSDTAETVVSTIEWRLERAALSDLECGVLEGKIVPWTMASIRTLVDNPQVRAELQRIASSYKPGDPTETRFDSLQNRVRAYATQLLEVEAE